MPAWTDDFNAAGYDIADVAVYQLLATRLNLLYRLATWTGGSAVSTPAAGDFLSELIAELQDEVEALVGDFYYEPVPTSDRLMNFARLLGTGRTGWRRKRPWELDSGGSLVIPAGAPSTSPAAGDKAIAVDGLVRNYSGTAWELSGNPAGDVPNTWELEGQIEAGDYLGGWLLNELRDAMQGLTEAWATPATGSSIVVYATGGSLYYGFSDFFPTSAEAAKTSAETNSLTDTLGPGSSSPATFVSSFGGSGSSWSASFRFEHYSYGFGTGSGSSWSASVAPVACDGRLVASSTDGGADAYFAFGSGLIENQFVTIATTTLSVGASLSTSVVPSYTFSWPGPANVANSAVSSRPTFMAKLIV